MNKLFILLMLLGLLTVQSAFGQSIRPLGLTFETTTHYDEAEWKWTPIVSFRVLGPIEGGSQISVDFTSPTGKVVTAKCETYPVIAGENRRIDQCGRNLEFAKATNQTGVFSFQIKLGNALNGTNKVLYAGKFTIGKILYNLDGTPDKNKQFHYFVDNDFRLGYSYIDKSVDEIYAEVWLKNKIMSLPGLTGYLFYNGKQIEEVSPSFPLKLHPKENAKECFELVSLRFPSSMENPGEYEIKLMRDKKLIRSVKFTVGADGKLVNNNIGRDLVGGTDILAPAQILGTSDGTYNKLAWKEGIFGNPISNLIVP